MDQKFGIKDLSHVSIKAITPFTLGERSVEEGEPVLYFETIQLASITQDATPIMARGGKGNYPLVIWENSGDVTFQLNAGILSQYGLSLLQNSRIILPPVDDTLLVPYSEVLSLDIAGKGVLTNLPSGRKPIFCFLYTNNLMQDKLAYVNLDVQTLSFGVAHAGDNIFVDYYYEYGSQTNLYMFDKQRLNGTFSLEGRMELKGEIDGLVHTMLVTIPKMKIISSLSFRLGESASPTMSTFRIIAIPTKTTYSTSSVIEFMELQDEII